MADRFGDNGIVAAVIVDLGLDCPIVGEFVMSCRVMGKNIEYAIMEDVENDLRESGYTFLRGIYLPTAKNQPVAELYDRLGYQRIEVGKNEAGEQVGVLYELELARAPKRVHQVKTEREKL